MGPSEVPPAHRDRFVPASGVIAILAVLGVFADYVHPFAPKLVLWLPVIAAPIAAFPALLRTARTATLSEPTRRFWRHLTAALILIGAGVTIQAVQMATTHDPAGQHTGTIMLAFCTAGVGTVLYALLRLPLGRQSPGELLRVFLDAGTVMVAAAVFTWHYSTRDALNDSAHTAVYTSLFVTVIVLLTVFAVARFALSSHLYVHSGALRLIALGMLIGAVAPTFQGPLEAVDPYLFPDMATTPIVFFLACLAAERQRSAVLGSRRGAITPPRRSFSLLPYLAVVAVDGLLIAVTVRHDPDQLAAVVAAVLTTTLVVLRQLIAFRDNNRLLRQLDHGATHDALTQLPNRVLFHTRLQRALTGPTDRAVAVALIDLDDFKEVNDTLGHEVGDLLLIGVAKRLEGCLRVGDTVARLGGDEFVVVLDDADPAGAGLAAERMMNALRQPVYADGHELPIRASIGIADGRVGDEPSALLRHADIAMYAAKKLAGTAYLHYEPNMAATGSEHAHLGAELREAITGGQLFLLYQPIVSLDDGRIVGSEALVRWAHPTRGALAPDSFIPVAERTGLIVPLGRWVMRTAFAQFAGWIAEHGDTAPGVLNVNVSARDLRETGFADGVSALLGQHGLAADRIVLEITETMALEPGQSIVNLHRLRALGVRVSLDDFGTGHSTLTLLHDCPIDEIKLDRAFTQAQVDGRPPIAAAVIHLAQALGLHAVAEGVETAEQAEQLLSLGYTTAQGYYFARPMPPAKFSELLGEPTSLMPAPEWQMTA